MSTLQTQELDMCPRHTIGWETVNAQALEWAVSDVTYKTGAIMYAYKELNE